MSISFHSKLESGLYVDSPFHALTFPAGEAHIVTPDAWDPNDYTLHIADVRGHDPQDLFMLAMWEEMLYTVSDDSNNPCNSAVLMPYLPGARADRGNPVGAKVYANFLNGLFLGQIVTLDPHSPVMQGYICNTDKVGAGGNNLTVFPFERIIKNEIQDASSGSKPQPYVGVIAPDRGAVDRAARAARVMGVPVYRAEKTRNFETGRLSGFHMVDSLPESGNFLLIDDICDGGRTFVGLADVIYESNPNVSLDLWVTHGVFPKEDGFKQLTQVFGKIHTTDSYHIPDNDNARLMKLQESVVVHKLAPYLYGELNTV